MELCPLKSTKCRTQDEGLLAWSSFFGISCSLMSSAFLLDALNQFVAMWSDCDQSNNRQQAMRKIGFIFIHAVLLHEAADTGTGLPDFSWCNIPKRGKIYQMTIKYSKWPENTYVYQMAVK
jgi:hypothetical protein